MTSLVYPSYFGSIHQFAVMVQSETVVFEVEDNFQKQTNRNRMSIYGSNGIQHLFISTKHVKESHKKTKDVRICNDFDWQRNHFKSLEMAYRTSPFFEYFEDDIIGLYQKKHEFLLDFNFEVLSVIEEILGYTFNKSNASEYIKNPQEQQDFRHLIVAKKDNYQNTEYIQVFSEKHGFLNNLSVLDLIFNEGKYALDYLRNQQL